jgi:hypothetical protein
MNILQKSVKGLVLGLMLIVSISALPAAIAHAQDDSGYSSGCDLCGTSYSPDTTSFYSPDTTSYYSPDTTSYYSPDSTSYYSPDTTSYYSPDSTSYYSPDTTSYYSPTPSYSYTNPTYTSSPSYGSSGCGCSTPTYSVTNPSYSSPVYSTPATGYSSFPTYIPATGFSATPIFTPTPVTHTAVPTPISYSTPAAPSVQNQTQTSTQGNNQTTTVTVPVTVTNTNNNYNSNPNTNTVTNTNSAPVTQVAATPAQYITDYVYPATCSINASQTSIASGASTVLTWSSSSASTAILSSVGTVSTNGSLSVHPYTTTNYVLTVYSAQGTSSSCNVTVTVGNYVHNNAPYVSLTQIPYTGFDFGPVGDSIYWAALLAFAVAAAYLLVYYRGGAFALATALVSGRSTSTSTIKPMNFTEAEEETATPVEAPTIEHTPVVNARLASVVSPIQNLPTAHIRRMTSDAMIVNHSMNGDAPRIVITRG